MIKFWQKLVAFGKKSNYQVIPCFYVSNWGWRYFSAGEIVFTTEVPEVVYILKLDVYRRHKSSA